MNYLKNLVLKLEKEIRERFIGNEEQVRSIILNLLHRRSTALIRAPRGLGKSTLMLLLLKGIYGNDFVIVSGASEVKRGEIVGRLHIPSLVNEGEEKVIWSAFIKSPGKGLDEVNRLNPYTVAGIYHMLQFGEVWAYGHRYGVKDYTLIGNENPHDETTFIHSPPFYDRFDICVYLNSLSFSEKFKLEEINEKFKSEIVESMPQVITEEELAEIRKEVEEVELNVEIKGFINLIIRDLQACIRNKEYSEVKPPVLCEGCHFARDLCSMVKEGVSERGTLVLTNLAKAKLWLHGRVTLEDILTFLRWVLPHRIKLTRSKSVTNGINSLIKEERRKMKEREARKQWLVLDALYKGFSKGLYFKAREIALEDIVFAEELIKLERKWIKEGKIKEEESLTAYLGAESYKYGETK